MYMLYAPRLPEEIKTVALMAQTAPAALDLAGLPRAPAEPKNVPVPVPGQAKGVLPGGQSDRPRFRGRRPRRPRRRRRNR